MPCQQSLDCPVIRFPAATYRAYNQDADLVERQSWYGSLIEEKSDDSGLMYMRNRYYNPATGAFTQEDPIGVAGGLNTYGFANGDPATYSDPYGLCPCAIAIPIAIGASEVAGALATTAAAGWLIHKREQVARDLRDGAHWVRNAVGSLTALAAGSRPDLPGREIVSGEITVEHFYRGTDHALAHAHVRGGGPETRIGQNGKPLRGDPELTPQQRRVVEENKTVIRREIGRIGRWLQHRAREQKEPGGG